MLTNLTRFALKNLTRPQRRDLFNELTDEHNEAVKLAQELSDHELDMSWNEYCDVFDLSGEFNVFQRPYQASLTFGELQRQRDERAAEIQRDYDFSGYDPDYDYLSGY